MNTHKLPFHLTAAALIALAVPAAFAATETAPTVSFQAPAATPGAPDLTGVLQLNGIALKDGSGNFQALPAQFQSTAVILAFGGNAPGTLFNRVVASAADLQTEIVKYLTGGQTTLPSTFNVDGLRLTIYNQSNQQRASFITATPSVPTIGGSMTPGNLTTTNIGNALKGVAVRDPSPVTSTVSNVLAGTQFNSGGTANATVTGNLVASSATGQQQTVAQNAIASGETSLAAALLDSTTDASTTTATLSGSTLGMIGGNNGQYDAGLQSVTVSGNTGAATARANDSTATVQIGGANSGTGSAASTPNFGGTPPTGAINVSGDYIATGYQIVKDSSTVSSTLSDSVAGVKLSGGNVLNNSGPLDIDGNTLSATASGNRLGLTLDNGLTGSSRSSTAYALQTVTDTGVSASATASTIGLRANNGNNLTNARVTVSDNALATTATANSASTVASDQLDQASNSLRLGTEQFVQATAVTGVSVTANNNGNRVGVDGGSSQVGTQLVASDNRVSASATGNQQLQQLSLDGARVASSAGTVVDASQSLLPTGGPLSITAANNALLVGVSTQDLGGTSRVQVSGNSVGSSAVGNDGVQALNGLTGSVETGVALTQTQRAIETSASQPLAVNAANSSVELGYRPGNLSGTSAIAVSDNQLGSVAAVNRQQQGTGVLSGSVAGTAGVSLAATQTTDGASASASFNSSYLGLTQTPSNANGNLSLLVDGNRVNAQAALNSAVQALGPVSGTVSSAVGATATQTVSGTLSNPSVQATLSSNSFGSPQGSSLNASTSTGSVQVSGNDLAATAQANELVRQVGAISGTVSGKVGLDSAGTASSQSSTAAAVGASVTNNSVGLNNASNVNLASFSGQVSDNSLQAQARQNSYTETGAGLSGTLSSTGRFGSSLSQTSADGSSAGSSSTSATLANNSVGFNGSNFGTNSGNSAQVQVSGNTLRADALANQAAISLGGASGSIAGQVGSTLTQTQSSGTISATSTSTALGLGNNGSAATIASTSPVSVGVSDNRLLALAGANGADLSLGGIDGSYSASSGGLSVTQSQGSALTASNAASNFDVIGVYANPVGGSGNTASTPITISGNQSLTAGTGNSARSDLGTVRGDIASGAVLGSSVTQTFGAGNANASVNATTGTLTIGVRSTNNFGGGTPASGGQVPVSISGNRMATTATANESSSSVAIDGSVAGTLNLATTQTANLNGSGTTAGLNATSGSSSSSTSSGIGFTQTSAGSGLSGSVTDNVLSSAVTGNGASDVISAINTPSASGTINLGATQTLNGNAGTTGLTSKVQNSSVGYQGDLNSNGATSSNLALNVSGNDVFATANGNTASHTVASLSGALNGGGSTALVAFNDQQTVNNAFVTASIAGSQVGLSLNTSNATRPGSLTVNGNRMIAQAVANSSVQQVTLDGVSTAARPVTSFNATQSTINTSTTASLTGSSIGLGSYSSNTARYDGSAVVSNNVAGATAIGNSATLIRTGR